MAGSLSLEIIFGDDPEDLFAGSSSTWHADGLEPEQIPQALLQATLGLLQMRAIEALRKEFSFGSEEILQQMAEAEARLYLLHMAVHVPAPPMQGVESTY